MEAIMIQQEDIEKIIFEEGETDLSYWEFINNSDVASDDDGNNGSIETLSLDSLSSWNSSLSSSPNINNSNNNNTNQNPLQDLIHDDDIDRDIEGKLNIDLGFLDFSDGNVEEEEQVEYDVGFAYYHQYRDDGVDEEDDDDDDDDVDDELVPYNLSGKLVSNRMRKLGKRACAKITTAKRNPYRYVKPGCVHGKASMGWH